MNRTKAIILGLLCIYGIWVIIAMQSPGSSRAFLVNQPSWTYILILFPIVIILVGYFWFWGVKQFFKMTNRQDISMDPPSLKNRLSKSPLEWIHLMAILFIIVPIFGITGVLIQSGEIYRFGLIGIAYGVGLLWTIRLIIRSKQ